MKSYESVEGSKFRLYFAGSCLNFIMAQVLGPRSLHWLQILFGLRAKFPFQTNHIQLTFVVHFVYSFSFLAYFAVPATKKILLLGEMPARVWNSLPLLGNKLTFFLEVLGWVMRNLRVLITFWKLHITRSPVLQLAMSA